MTQYKLIDDSGVDYSFLSAFSYARSWKDQILRGKVSPHLEGHITVEKPFNIPGTFTAPRECFVKVDAKCQ